MNTPRRYDYAYNGPKPAGSPSANFGTDHLMSRRYGYDAERSGSFGGEANGTGWSQLDGTMKGAYIVLGASALVLTACILRG